MITVNGIERDIDRKELRSLARKHLPIGMGKEYKKVFADMVAWLMADLEIDDVYLKGKSAEEYYFNACLAYSKENSYTKFFYLEDDTEVFEYCGN